MSNNYQHAIPEMTHPLGKHWEQPATSKILITDVRAVMSKAVFDKISDYSGSIPTGVYAGKMWKSFFDGLWHLRWFEDHPAIINRCTIKQRIIFVVG